MKKIILFVILSVITLQIIHAQTNNPAITTDSVIGRWMEESRQNITTDSLIEPAQPYMYIFKQDSVFHRGEVSEGVILFNITGKYTISDHIINIRYMDFSNKRPGKVKEKNMTFEIKEISKDTMIVVCNESRYKTYQLTLKRQQY
ncbi:MAG: hypothetical protein QM660_02365 [Dysgonomonas sp.]